MSDSIDAMPDRVHRLAIRQLAGELSETDRAELIGLLSEDAASRRVYLEHMQDSVSLRWMFSGAWNRKTALALAERSLGTPARSGRRVSGWMIALAAGIACVAAWPSFMTRNEVGARAVRDAEPVANVATVTDVAGVQWSSKDAEARRLSRVPVNTHFEFKQGMVELTFDSRAEVKVFGPAKFKILSPNRILCSYGRATTLVEEGGQGFTIDTPKARIVDLGTEFGVDISETGDTQVVVFQGSVDLTKPTELKADAKLPTDAAEWTRRLQQGDGVRLDAPGEAQRLMAVQRGDFFPGNLLDHYGRPRRAPVILDVRDNIRDPENNKCYQIVWGGLREDAPGFVDREHQWNGAGDAGMPEFLLGADYIMPFNDDKFISDLRVDITVAWAATCYVFFDDNMSPPSWLTRDFRDTGLDVALDGGKTEWHKDHQLGVGSGRSIDFPFSVWRREVTAAGTVTLGGVNPPKEKTRSRGFNMYGIAVVPR
jgi:ferric-dicitrate binding protein FerR (iron transport regulator)